MVAGEIEYIPRNMHTLLCFVVVIHWLIFPYPSGLLHWHCGNLTNAPVPAKQPWWIWINTSCEFIMNDCITTTKQSTTKPCAYFLGYTVCCVQTSCAILLELHSIYYNVPYGQTQRYSVIFLWFYTCDHIVVVYSQSFLTLYANTGFMVVIKLLLSS